MAKFEILNETKEKISFLLKDSYPAYANALRRIMLTEVPVIAIEEVEFRKNTSVLYDEIIAHRLGLVPLTTDLRSYELPNSEEDIKERKAKCTLTLTLKEKGPKTVYASDLVSADPKIKPVYGKIPIVKLLKEQELELSAVAVLGKGKEHSKWSACHVWYNYNPNLKINNNHKDFEKYKEVYPEQVFNKKGEIDEALIIENNLIDAVANVNDEIVKVDYNDKEFIFYLESWGQLSPREILSEALDIFDGKLNKLSSLI